MFFLGVAIAAPILWFLPWWVLALVTALFGALLEPGPRLAILYSVGVSLTWVALAFIRNGQSHGLISPRIAGLFFLPGGEYVYILVFLIAMISTWLWIQSGTALLQLSKSLTPGQKN